MKLTVKDLIDILHTYPSDMYVANDMGVLTEKDIKIMKDFYEGDSANVENEPIDKVVYIN